MSGLGKREEGKYGYARSSYMMLNDFPQPPLYKTMFTRWGLYEK